jgi:nucleoside permease NupC
MKGYSNYIHMPLVLIVVVLTLIAGPTITYLINPYNAKAAQFEIDKSQFKKAPEFTQITGYIIHLDQ